MKNSGPKFDPGQIVVFKKQPERGQFLVDGSVTDFMGRWHTALSKDGKGAGCVPQGILKEAEGK